MLTAAGFVSLAIWLYLLTGRGGFWRVSKQLAPRDASFSGSRKVAVVVPARDEEAVIGETVRSLLAQSWTGPLELFVVDDNSSDGTAAVARSAGQNAITVLSGTQLPPGWTGKMWALAQGVESALRTKPDYLLFTDADIRHDPDCVKTLLAIAETHDCDLASFMVKLSCSTFAERLLIPSFVFFFFQLYPPAWIFSRSKRTAGAAGGCLLIRPAALQRAGGLDSIRSEVIDDCALARAVKRSGGRIWLGLSPSTRSTRVYNSFGQVGAMISRTAFNQLRHSTLLLAGTIVGLVVTFVLPIALLFSGALLPAVLGGATLTLMALAYWPTVRFYNLSAGWALSLPFAGLFYMGATMVSAIRYWQGRGGSWKGRAQDSIR